MSNIAPQAARQVLRSCSRPFHRSTSAAVYRPATACCQKIIQTRNYVSETKPQNATINVDTTIKADQKAFIQKKGEALQKTTMPGTRLNAEAMMSPVAGVLKQATVMDEGARQIYLEMQAKTPVDPRFLDAMLPFMTGLYGNPHSRTHAYGWETEKAVEQARKYIADL